MRSVTLPLLLALGGCVDTTPVRHMRPPMATGDCGRLHVMVDGKPDALVYAHAWLHHTLVNGGYDETLALYWGFRDDPVNTSSGMEVDFGDQPPSSFFLRLFGERDLVASMPAALLPGSTLVKGGTIHVCLGPAKLVVPPRLGQTGDRPVTVEISGQIDAVIDEVTTHVAGEK